MPRRKPPKPIRPWTSGNRRVGFIFEGENQRAAVTGGSSIYDAYQLLICAIIAQAAKDRCKLFFCGPDAPITFFVSTRIDGDALWEQIQRNYADHNDWKAKDAVIFEKFQPKEGEYL